MTMMRYVLLVGYLLSSTYNARADDVNSTAHAELGVWQKRSYTLQYMGFTSTYSCDGLVGKLRLLVKAAGARNDVKASPGACSLSFGRPDKLASATVTFYTLTPVENPDSHAVGDKTPGRWQPVVITDRMPRELSRGDCELVEQFRDQLLPMFTIRAAESRFSCVPNQDAGSSFSLRFDSFQPVAPK